MDVTQNLQRLGLKELLTTPQEAKDFFMNNELMLGLTSQTKPVRVVVNPSNDYGDCFGKRVTYFLPRYNFLQGLELQFTLPELTAFTGDTDLVRTGYLRSVGALVKRIEIKYASYSYIVPEDWLVHSALIFNDDAQLKKKYRSGGWLHGTPPQGTNRTGGIFSVKIPCPWEGSVLPIGALSGEVSVEVWFRDRAQGFVETSYGGRFVAAYAANGDASKDDGLGSVGAAAASPANIGQNITPNVLTVTPEKPELSNPKIIAHCINVDEATFAQVIEKVKSSGIAIPATEVGWVDADSITYAGAGAPTRINLSQISGLCYGLFVSIRKQPNMNQTDGKHSVLKTEANTRDITISCELNGQRLYSNEPVPLLQGAELLADVFKCSNLDAPLNRYVLTGLPFCVDGQKAIRNAAQTGFVDLTNSSSCFLNIMNPAAYDANNKIYVQIRALLHTVLIVDAAGLRKVNL